MVLLMNLCKRHMFRHKHTHMAVTRDKHKVQMHRINEEDVNRTSYYQAEALGASIDVHIERLQNRVAVLSVWTNTGARKCNRLFVGAGHAA